MKRFVTSILGIALLFSFSAAVMGASDKPKRGGTLTMGI
jgi:hypothetical protein